MSEPSKSEINRFVAEVDTFMANFARLNDPATVSAIYSSGNQALINDFESTRAKSSALKATIENTVGAWQTAKRTYFSATDYTSTVIGDAIDTVRGWFGYTGHVNGLRGMVPSIGLAGLGVLPQLVSAAWIAGIVSSAYLLNQSIMAILRSAEASKLQKENPNLSREAALELAAAKINIGSFFGAPSLPFLAVAGVALWYFWGKKK